MSQLELEFNLIGPLACYSFIKDMHKKTYIHIQAIFTFLIYLISFLSSNRSYIRFYSIFPLSLRQTLLHPSKQQKPLCGQSSSGTPEITKNIFLFGNLEYQKFVV